MSETCSKSAIRIMLPDLQTKSIEEQLEWFENRFGKCRYVDKIEGKITGFYEREFESIPKDIEIVRDNKDRFAIDIILEKVPEYDAKGMNLSLSQIRKIANKTIKKYKIDNIKKTEDIRIVSYIWYDGCDEPYVRGLDK